VPREYIAPRWGSSNDRLAGYFREAVQEGAAWLSTQRPAADWEAIIERFGGSVTGDLAGSSNVSYPKMERLARELVAALSSFSHVGEVKPAATQKLYSQAGILTKLDHHWFHLAQTYESVRKLLQYAIALGTAYAWQTWDPHFYGEYKGDIRLTALPPQNVTFVQLPGDHDIQRAYVTLIREELPITLAQRIYRRTNPAFAAALLPDRDAPGWIARGLKKVQEFLSPALRVRGMRPGEFDQQASFPTVDIFHAYINDDTINQGDSVIEMGTTGTNWSYTVPPLGSPLPTALMNPATQQPFTRPADHADALMFPLKRYAIFARTTDIVCYDNSSPWWHGRTPLVKLAFNDLPWEALGRSAVGMVRPLEDSIVAIMQATEDSIACRVDPPAVYNDQAVSLTWAQAFSGRKAGARAAADLTQGDVIKFPIPAQNYDIPQWIEKYMLWLDDRCEYLTGARDLTAIAKAKQIPSSDAQEKLLEMAGPLTQDMVKAIVMPFETLGQMRLSDYFQFYTYDRVLSYTADAGDPEDWVYTPDLLVGRLDGESFQQRRSRARSLVSAFLYRVTQSGITEINRMTTKLFYLQLMKIPNFPMDWWTFAKVAQFPQFGKIPNKMDEEGNVSDVEAQSMIERYFAQMRLLAEAAQKYGGGQQPPPHGRPPSGNAAPHLVNKSGGTRSTVATSR
jgi:hypothetical protein